MAGIDGQAARRRPGSHRHTGQGRQALQARGLGAAFPVRLHQAELPHCRGCAARRGRQRRGPGRRDEAQGQLLHPPVHRRARAVELRADQSGSVPRDDRHRRTESRQGAPQPPRRSRARRRPAQDLDDRPQGVRARRQHRDDARQGRLPERSHPAHPVRADDGEGREAASAHHPAVDQQVLHPRFAREELVREVGGGSGSYRLRRLLGQSRRQARAQGFRGLPDRRHARRAHRDREGHRREGSQRRGLLPRRHAARRHARLHGRHARTSGSPARRS